MGRIWFITNSFTLYVGTLNLLQMDDRNTYVPMYIVKLQHINRIERGFLKPTFMFPVKRPLHRSMSNSPTPSALFGSSKTKGMVDAVHRSRHKVSDVLLVFIK